VARDPYLFIINPSSGTTIGRSPEAVAAVIEHIGKNHDAPTQIVFTRRRGHATELVEEHLRARNWAAVVAVGGDGTVNEVAKGLVHQDVPLGILPLGSGNGLARHLGLPLTLQASVSRLFEGKPITIDSAELNGLPYFCTAGVGFDAHVGHRFGQQKKRGLATYVSVSLKSYWNYKAQKYRLNGEEVELFSLSFANAGQYGNNAWIAPLADIQDGLLDVCALKAFPLWFGPGFGYEMFTKKLKPSPYLSYQRVREFAVECSTPPIIHYDGEPLQLDTCRIEVKVIPMSLRVIV
jgi:diacylglycerol kinase (ATP)